MTYSKRNPAWGRLQKQRYDDRIQAEACLAEQIMEQESISRPNALRRAAAIIEKNHE